MRKIPRTKMKAPYLRRIWFEEDAEWPDDYPHVLPFLQGGRFAFAFERPLTVFVGENGTGKSTLLEAIGGLLGYNAGSGSRDHGYAGGSRGAASILGRSLRASFLPKVTAGFFFRAESFFNLATYIDDIDDPRSHAYWGERGLHTRSHGELFLALCHYRLSAPWPQMLIFDEPEAALSPARQLEFLRHIDAWLAQGNVQIVMATHSPILMAHPEADLWLFDGGRVRRGRIEETGHYRIARDFLEDPHGAAREALKQPFQFADRMQAEDREFNPNQRR